MSDSTGDQPRRAGDRGLHTTQPDQEGHDSWHDESAVDYPQIGDELFETAAQDIHPEDHEYYESDDYEYEYDAEDDQRALGVVTRGRRRRRGVGVLVLLLCLGLVGGAAWFGFDQVRQVVGSFTGTNDYPGPGSGDVTVVIKDGDSGRAIGKTLEQAGVVKSSSAFVDALQESGAANAMQPGTYQMMKEMSAAGAVALLQNPASRINIQVRIREGLWKTEVFAAIEKETGFTAEQLEAASQDPALGLPAEAAGNVEGYLFPATYTFQPDVTPVDVLKQMVAKYNEEMAKAQVAPQDQRRVLILASLVQAEASNPDDFPKVARVIENRLVKQPTVPLGFDTTVNFALQKRGFDLTKADLASDSPYNTRKFPGLPPGPIDSPGAAAIEAAAHPAAGDWLYFVTVNPDTGETLFTADYNEFLRGKDQFNAWYTEHKKTAEGAATP